MSDSAPDRARFATRLASHAWWVLLLAALALLWAETARRIDRVEALTNSPTWSVDPPSPDASSPTGFERGQRRLVVPRHHNPSYWWIMEAQQSVREGSLRLHHIDYDSPPDGREIRRTSLYRWWLIAVGWVRGLIRGEPPGFAIERGTLVADPILLGLLLVAGTIYTARHLGLLAASGFAVAAVSLFPLAVNFQPGAPDPHSLAWVLALGSILPLLAGFRRSENGTKQRIHFAVAGVWGGLGLWNDAPSQAPVLLAIFLGGTGYEIVRARHAARSPNAPGVSSWRSWALAGALTTLGASVFEFAPDHFSWSLASINPIHAIVWWGSGEVLRAVGMYSRAGRQGFGWRSLALLGPAVAAIAAWPVVGLWTGSGGLLASDFYALELATHPAGGFAPSSHVWLHRTGDAGAKWATLLPCVILFLLVVRIFRTRTGGEERGRLFFVLVAALFVFGLAHSQLRWWNLFDVLALVAVAALLNSTEACGMRTRFTTWALPVALVLPGLFVGFPPAVGSKGVKNLSPMEAQALIERDFSYWLALRRGPEPIVLFSTPMFSGAAAFYGGFDVVASNDDENKDGYLTAVRIASAATAQEASVLLRTRGITHLALPLWDPTLQQLVRIGRNLSDDQSLPANAFTVSLQQWDFPLWMRPMDYAIPREAGLEGFDLRVFALQAESSPELGLSRLADLFLERGQLRDAQSVRKSLELYPRSAAALGAIARIDLAVRDRSGLEDAMEKLLPSLSRRSARDLPADRRISIAGVLIETRHVDQARDQVNACFEDLDAATLRTLTPASVVNLLALSRSLEVPFPDEDLKAVALELIPPSIRAGLTKH